MELSELIIALSNATKIGNIDETVDIIKDYLSPIEVKADDKGNITAFKKGKSDKTLLIDAHLDEVGFIITNIDKGFLTVSAIGGIDPRILKGQPVKIFGKKIVKGVFISTPPHLKKGDGTDTDINEIKVDTGLDDANKLISLGDKAVLDIKATKLLNNRICGKALDNRAGVSSALYAFKNIKNPYCNLKLLLSSDEEIGCRGAVIGGYEATPYKAIAVDVSFGDYPDIPSFKTRALGSGAMVGISPVLNYEMSKELIALDNNNTVEIMGAKTGTTADVLALTKSGVKTALLSIPLRNMHTPVEVIDVNDVLSVSNLLIKYAESEEKE